MAKHYQYIIIGAGCAGLQLAKSLLNLNPTLVNSILLIESSKTHIEKSWCFWYEKEHPYKHLVKKEWSNVQFLSDNLSITQSIFPKSYQYINSLDFFNDCMAFFSTDDRIDVLYDTVLEVTSSKEPVVITTNNNFSCNYVFYTNPKLGNANYKAPTTWQQFVGWIIETKDWKFDANVATMMDFTIDNSKFISFVYVLPFTTTKALVECTIFSTNPQQPQYYEDILQHYIAQKFTSNYTITGKEYGKIPMQLTVADYKFPNNIIPIGAAAGCIKASTGYSFVRVMMHTQSIITAIKNKQTPCIRKINKRFLFYDKLFLSIIHHKPTAMKKIFYKLFKHNTIATVLSFLDEQTILLQDAKIFLRLPKTPFLEALFRKNKPECND